MEILDWPYAYQEAWMKRKEDYREEVPVFHNEKQQLTVDAATELQNIIMELKVSSAMDKVTKTIHQSYNRLD